MGYTERFSEQAALLGTIYCAASTGEKNTGYLSLENYNRAVVIIHPVNMNSQTIDVDLEQGTDTSGTSAKTFNSGGKDITIAAADTKPSVIEIRTEELDVDGGFDCINVEATPSGSCTFVVELWGLEPRYKPVSTTNLDSVTD